MPSRNEITAPAEAEHNTLYVAIEISGKSWVVGVKSPDSERIGLHSLGPADVEGLRNLIEQQQAKAESSGCDRAHLFHAPISQTSATPSSRPARARSTPHS